MKGMKGKDTAIRFGGTPRADLLPPEIRTAQRERSTLRMLVIVIVAVGALVAGGIAIASIGALASQVLLSQERQRSEDLLAQQLKYAEARQIANRVDASIAAQLIATSTEIDWEAYLGEVSSTLPAGVSLVSVDVASISPVESAEIAEAPLQGTAVATVTITARSVTVPDVEAWLGDLEGITGFAGIAPPATVEGSPDDGYDVGIKLLVSQDAFLLRFLDDAEGK